MRRCDTRQLLKDRGAENAREENAGCENIGAVLQGWKIRERQANERQYFKV